MSEPETPELWALCNSCDDAEHEACFYPALRVAWDGGRWLCDECWDYTRGEWRAARKAAAYIAADEDGC